MRALVVGGAGFIGANVARRHLGRGDHVTLLDNLSRKGARQNLFWLEEEAGSRLEVVLGDAARDASKVATAVRQADVVYHLAGQVAVTRSLVDPLADHEANVASTLLLLEAMRACGSSAPLVFASTNKVYGQLEEVGSVLAGGRWAYGDGRSGIDEAQPLDFHSPYGCSKGSADQYARDYARVYGLNTLVFRQSCIYGPRQFGIEDQGWLVHFILAFAHRRKVTVFGDGRQVRDVLYVDDLLDAYDLAVGRASELRGEVFNVGGGAGNRLSILDLLALLEGLFGHSVEVGFGPWRKGDQKVFVSDNGKASTRLGWHPAVGVEEGLRRTTEFVRGSLDVFGSAFDRPSLASRDT